MFGIHWRGEDDQRNLVIRLLRLPKDEPLTFWAFVVLIIYHAGFYAFMVARYS